MLMNADGSPVEGAADQNQPPADDNVTQTQQVDQQPDTSKKDDDLSPSVKAALEAAAQAAATAREATARWDQFAAQMASRQAQPAPQPEPPDPLEGLDPETGQAVKQYIEHKIKDTVGQIAQEYSQDRMSDLAYRAKLERREAARSLPDWDKYSVKIDEYMQQVPPHLQAVPGAWEEAYYVIVGQEVARERQAAAQRAPAVATETRAPTTSAGAPGAKLTKEQRAFVAEALGVTLDDDEFAVLSNQEVNIRDYAELMAGKGGGNG